MAKKVLRRVCIGFMAGVFLGQVTQLILSYLLGSGEFIAVLDKFSALFTTEFAAVLTQFLLTGLLGVAFALGTFIFEIDHWGLMKQFLTHLFTTGVVWLVVVFLCWTPLNAIGYIIIIINFIGAYSITYWIQLSIARKEIEKINAALQAES